MGLTPRQPADSSKYNWSQLDILLRTMLNRENSEWEINIANFAMSEQEIISEAERCGYIVSKPRDGVLRFK